MKTIAKIGQEMKSLLLAKMPSLRFSLRLAKKTAKIGQKMNSVSYLANFVKVNTQIKRAVELCEKNESIRKQFFILLSYSYKFIFSFFQPVFGQQIRENKLA